MGRTLFLILSDIKYSSPYFEKFRGQGQPLKTGSIYTYIHPVIILDFTPRCETLFNKTSPRKANISPSREPNDSHQVGLQNKFRSHVHRMISGLFYDYENSTELDEVGNETDLNLRKNQCEEKWELKNADFIGH